MVKYGFPRTWKVAIEIKREGNQWDKSNSSFISGQKKNCCIKNSI
jgi:hypothetical protein